MSGEREVTRGGESVSEWTVGALASLLDAFASDHPHKRVGEAMAEAAIRLMIADEDVKRVDRIEAQGNGNRWCARQSPDPRRGFRLHNTSHRAHSFATAREAIDAMPPAALSQAGEPPSDDDDPTDETLITDAILCRVFDADEYDRLREEWRAFDKSGWFHWSRAFGAFLNGALQARAAAQAGEPGREVCESEILEAAKRVVCEVYGLKYTPVFDPELFNTDRTAVLCVRAGVALSASSGATREGAELCRPEDRCEICDIRRTAHPGATHA